MALIERSETFLLFDPIAWLKQTYPMESIMPFRLMFLAGLLLLGSTADAHTGRATAQGYSEEFATAEAMRQMPKGSTLTDTTCKSIELPGATRYECTITYDD